MKKDGLPTFIRPISDPKSPFKYRIHIANITGFNRSTFTYSVESMDDALFYRNYVLDLVGRDRPDEEEPQISYRPTNHPEIYAPIPVRIPTQKDF